jgi:hypothetical protein
MKVGMMHQWEHWPVSSLDVTPSENRPKHQPTTMSIRENGYMHYRNVQSINQLFNQSIIIDDDGPKFDKVLLSV